MLFYTFYAALYLMTVNSYATELNSEDAKNSFKRQMGGGFGGNGGGGFGNMGGGNAGGLGGMMGLLSSLAGGMGNMGGGGMGNGMGGNMGGGGMGGMGGNMGAGGMGNMGGGGMGGGGMGGGGMGGGGMGGGMGNLGGGIGMGGMGALATLMSSMGGSNGLRFSPNSNQGMGMNGLGGMNGMSNFGGLGNLGGGMGGGGMGGMGGGLGGGMGGGLGGGMGSMMGGLGGNGGMNLLSSLMGGQGGSGHGFGNGLLGNGGFPQVGNLMNNLFDNGAQNIMPQMPSFAGGFSGGGVDASILSAMMGFNNPLALAAMNQNLNGFMGLHAREVDTQSSLPDDLLLQNLMSQLQQNQKDKFVKRHEYRGSLDDLQADIMLEAKSKYASCEKCIPLDFKKLSGTWIQIFGNPKSLERIFTKVSKHLLRPTESNPFYEEANPGDEPSRPSCIGYQFGLSTPNAQAYNEEIPLMVYFRKEGQDSNLLQFHATVENGKFSSKNRFRLQSQDYNQTLCLIESGPTSNYNTYLIFAETDGPQKCRAFHVITRNSAEYFTRYATEVTEFLQTSVTKNEIDIVKVLPYPEECEYRRPNFKNI